MKEKRKENRRKLWHSLELTVLRRDLIFIAVLALVLLLLYRARFDDAQKGIMTATVLVVTLPFIGFYLFRIWQIFRKAEAYTFHRCTLSQPRSKPFLKTMCFYVVINEPGRTFAAETHAIFAPYGYMGPLMEDYVNKTAAIAYNPETEQVVVIG